MILKHVLCVQCSSVSVTDDMYAFGKTHMRSTPSLRLCFSNVALKKVPVLLRLTLVLCLVLAR